MSNEVNVAYPIGLRVTNVRMMTKDELSDEGWDHSFGGFPVVIEFEDGSKIYGASDPEGNDAGCLFGMTKDGEALIVSPLLTNEMVKDGKTS